MLKRIAFSVLLLGFLAWGAPSGSLFYFEHFSPARPAIMGLDSSPGSPSQKGSVKPAKSKLKYLFKSFQGVIEVSGHLTASKPGLTNYVATIYGNISFNGKEDAVTDSSGSLTYGMSGWNANDGVPGGRCLHKASGTIQADLMPTVSVILRASDVREIFKKDLKGKDLSKEQESLFKGTDHFLLATTNNFEVKMTSYLVTCGSTVVPMPLGTWRMPTIGPLYLPVTNYAPFKFTGYSADEWTGDLTFTITSFDGRSK
jgi:hypothetical protein